MADARSHWAHGNRVARLLARSHSIIVATTCLLVLSGCASGTASGNSRGVSATPSATSGSSASSGVLPHFSDWRAAYLAPDGRAHIVTLDGKTDLAGPALPDLTSNGLVVANAGVGPDGKTLAYAADAGLDLVDLTGQTPPRMVQVQGGFNDILWSPDQRKLYSYMGGGQFFFVTLATGHATNVAPGVDVREVGWIDNTHLATMDFKGANYVADGSDEIPTSAKLESLDLTSGQARTITTIQGNGPTGFQFIISPDGSQALYYDARFRGFAFTPRVALINLATGHVTSLPTIAQATGADFFRVAWRPDSNTIAVSTDYMENGNGNLKTWLLDVAADTATPIAATGYPMGWAPNHGPLALSSGWQSGVGQGPYSLTAVTCVSGAQCSTATLTRNAIDFTFLGFVRNP